jgi:hypothetical protein
VSEAAVDNVMRDGLGDECAQGQALRDSKHDAGVQINKHHKRVDLSPSGAEGGAAVPARVICRNPNE